MSDPPSQVVGREVVALFDRRFALKLGLHRHSRPSLCVATPGTTNIRELKRQCHNVMGRDRVFFLGGDAEWRGIQGPGDACCMLCNSMCVRVCTALGKHGVGRLQAAGCVGENVGHGNAICVWLGWAGFVGM